MRVRDVRRAYGRSRMADHLAISRDHNTARKILVLGHGLLPLSIALPSGALENRATPPFAGTAQVEKKSYSTLKSLSERLNIAGIKPSGDFSHRARSDDRTAPDSQHQANGRKGGDVRTWHQWGNLRPDRRRRQGSLRPSAAGQSPAPSLYSRERLMWGPERETQSKQEE
jgi:hypothetical protein